MGRMGNEGIELKEREERKCRNEREREEFLSILKS